MDFGSADRAFRRWCFWRDLTNTQLLKPHNIRCDGMVVTASHSGTHWLDFMLGTAMAHRHGLPPPAAILPPSAEFLGRSPSKGPRPYPHLPVIARNHYLPHRLLGSRAWRRLVRPPPTVVLVRDFRASLVSWYEKHDYELGGLALSAYLRGDPSRRRFNRDVWWFIYFFNRWGRLVEAFPPVHLVLRYEEMRADAAGCLGRIAGHFALDLGPGDIAAAVAAGTKERMAALDPVAVTRKAIRTDARDPLARWSAQDRSWLAATLARHLTHDFGYAFDRWPG